VRTPRHSKHRLLSVCMINHDEENRRQVRTPSVFSDMEWHRRKRLFLYSHARGPRFKSRCVHHSILTPDRRTSMLPEGALLNKHLAPEERLGHLDVAGHSDLRVNLERFVE
jgi:hypothetical protein